MNEPENLSPSSPEASLQLQIADLNRQTIRLFIGLVITSLMLAAFVGLQARRAGKDLDLVRPQAMQVIEINTKQTPLIQNFVSQLAAYAQGHPDYAEKVFSKYVKPGTVPVGATQPITAPKK